MGSDEAVVAVSLAENMAQERYQSGLREAFESACKITREHAATSHPYDTDYSQAELDASVQTADAIEEDIRRAAKEQFGVELSAPTVGIDFASEPDKTVYHDGRGNTFAPPSAQAGQGPYR